jgi:endonuclease YncB( thermonuclease family)
MRRLRRTAPFLLFLAAVLFIYVELVDQGKIPASVAWASVPAQPNPLASIICNKPHVNDGDTIRCDRDRIRLDGIDTPEMPGHCRKGRECTKGDPFAAKQYLENLVRGGVVCQPSKKDHYGRWIALCRAGGVDLSCAMIKSGHAVRRYSSISCL